MALPSEFVIYGMPVSLQGSAGNRRRFQQSLRVEALRIWGDSPTVRDFVAVEILFCVNKATKNIPDMDNAMKPILDALKNVAYDDDDQVTDIICRKRFFESKLASPDPSPTFLHGDHPVHLHSVDRSTYSRILTIDDTRNAIRKI